MNQMFLHNIKLERSKQLKLFLKQEDNFSFLGLLIVIIFLQKLWSVPSLKSLQLYIRIDWIFLFALEVWE